MPKCGDNDAPESTGNNVSHVEINLTRLTISNYKLLVGKN